MNVTKMYKITAMSDIYHLVKSTDYKLELFV